MTRFYYETGSDLRGRWFVYDRKRGEGAPGSNRSLYAVAMCFSRDDAERIIAALNAEQPSAAEWD